MASPLEIWSTHPVPISTRVTEQLGHILGCRFRDRVCGLYTSDLFALPQRKKRRQSSQAGHMGLVLLTPPLMARFFFFFFSAAKVG